MTMMRMIRSGREHEKQVKEDAESKRKKTAWRGQPPSPHDMRSSLHKDASLEPNKSIPPLTFRQFSLAEWSKC